MLAMSKGALTAAQAATYYDEKYSQDDYYSEQHQIVGQWFGRGAEELGLSGEVATGDFRAVLRGQQPGTGAVLVPKAHGYNDRRAGWDATFNAPKSISIQALAGEDQRLIGAHRQAVSRALEELEQYALSRRHGGSEWVVTGKLVAARFEHIAARPASGTQHDGYGPDPHLHTHVVIANLTRRPDREWRGLDPVEIYRSQSFATAVYRSELAREVQELGYRIRIGGSDGRWELEGYTREQVMAFSQRRQDIERGLAQAGLSGAAAAQHLAHQTRRAKDHRDEASLKAEWRSRAQQYGIAFEPRWSLARVRSALQRWRPTTAEAALGQSIAENSEREAVIDRRTLEAKALQHAMGTIELSQIRSHRARLQQEGQLLQVRPSISSPHGAFTTPEMVALERDNITIMRAGQSQVRAIGAASEVRQWAAQRGLTGEQAIAAEVTLTARNWLTAIEGRAGAAKTTTVGAIREFAERRGYAVYGFAPTTRAVKSLQEAGVAARTVASLLASRSVSRPPKHIWIVDESSLLPTRSVNRLFQRARDEGVERVVFVGDQRQHHAIEAGRPIFQMQEAGMTVARLDTIRRQLDAALRAAVTHAAQGEIAESLAILDRRCDIREVVDPLERRKTIARDYAAAHRAGSRVLVISPGNAERRELNQAIRAELIARGMIETEGRQQTVLINRGLAGAQRATAANYEIGDVVRFARGSTQLGIARGDYVRIENVDREANRLSVTTGNGRRIDYSPARLFGVEVYHEEARTFAQGDRIQFRAADRALGVANGDFATIEAIDSRRAAIRLDSGKPISTAIDRLRHIDHGYASTSHSAQGATVDRVIVDIDTRLSPDLVNRKQFYVSISRARHGIAIYTDDRSHLRHAVNRNREKSLALEHEQRIGAPAHRIVADEPRHRITRGHGMRM